jgi:hypothetical protein
MKEPGRFFLVNIHLTMTQFFQHKKISGSVFCAFVIAMIISAIHARILYRDVGSISLQILMISSVDDTAKLYLDTGKSLSEQEVV